VREGIHEVRLQRQGLVEQRDGFGEHHGRLRGVERRPSGDDGREARAEQVAGRRRRRDHRSGLLQRLRDPVESFCGHERSDEAAVPAVRGYTAP
jgi:hypothetical protein